MILCNVCTLRQNFDLVASPFNSATFSHHAIHYEGQGGPVQASSKPRSDILALIGKASESLCPDIQHLLSHLKPDVHSSIYVAPAPKVPNPN